MTPHAELERSPGLGVVARAAGTIADPQVRNRGTVGGSLPTATPRPTFPP
jgi:CO/xanthine dehydrogenase FAD-binding subunit